MTKGSGRGISCCRPPGADDGTGVGGGGLRGERAVSISLGLRGGASDRTDPPALRVAFQAVSSLSHHPTRLGEMATGSGKSPAFCIRQAVVRLIPVWPLQQGILRFVGFEALSPNIIWSATYVDDAERRTAMEHYVERLRRVATEIPEAAHGRSEFGKDWRLLPEVSPRTVAHWRGQ